MPSYDHNRKAGNQGDLVKHVALIATAQGLSQPGKPFHYADLFAGYADNLLQFEGSWQQGIGVLHHSKPDPTNPALRHYLQQFQDNVALAGTFYPGSARFVQQLLATQNSPTQLSLYDIASKPLASLRQSFPEANIHNRAANVKDRAVKGADLLFIDPPGIRWTEKPEYPKAEWLLSFADIDLQQPLLYWLPLFSPQSSEAAEQSQKVLNALQQRGFQISLCRWHPEVEADDQVNLIGCALAYRLPATVNKAIEQALAETIHLAQWTTQHPQPLVHLRIK